ncbi:MAG: DNA polymerase III subunit delta [Candidatus Peribacter sp.]|jgi:DNA polymerase III subunit delta|nr:DNA polymerase III subunit delta [Candidatus Peribacter sp.]MBT4393039.1 DNA polymerase III subunit delta [Candidatus Peribacter sp.]MBT4600390.1 DNA polymerase III subunit delta [Candidatus Peribacter sp.]MBT5149348.1 DNA polymerase III subunit delta [Candidatus Peribacter sp.]MBT5637589.1 DNA polymerase III subunit delta [Candidatus Peribacter sp.]
MSQIYLFSGENLFEIDQEKRRWIAGFTQKHGEENITHIDGKKLKTGILMDEIAASPFIAEKRLIVLLGIPKMEKGEMLELQNVLHPQNLLLIVDPKPDKRLSSTKELLTIADVKQFAPLRNERLTTWISAQAQLFGSSISRESAQHLVATVGEDQMLLASEMRKLATFAGQKQITNNDIDELVMLSEEQAGWKLMDLVAANKCDEALVFSRQLLLKGESPYALWSKLIWLVSQLTLVSAALDDGIAAPPAITKSTGVSFGTVRTVLPLARKIDDTRLEAIVSRFAQTDKALKTGGYKSTVEAPEELLSIIDQSIVMLSRS